MFCVWFFEVYFQPSSEIQDKISFIINNIAVTNVEAKAKEFSDILKDEYFPWFAQYMVMKRLLICFCFCICSFYIFITCWISSILELWFCRASIEPNFHELYLKFLDKVDSKALNKDIVQATYENCKVCWKASLVVFVWTHEIKSCIKHNYRLAFFQVLLGSELIKSSSEERSLLKNLGSWLGKLTIGRNKVLRYLELDPKSLIIEVNDLSFVFFAYFFFCNFFGWALHAHGNGYLWLLYLFCCIVLGIWYFGACNDFSQAYEKGLMIAVIPFTSKVLQFPNIFQIFYIIFICICILNSIKCFRFLNHVKVV